MKTKLKIFEIFVVFIAILLLIGAVSASDESISNDTVKMSELETTEVTADESDLNLESADNEIITQEEPSQDPVITQTNDNKLSNSTGDNSTVEAVITSSNLKTDYHSGKSVKAIITDKATGKGISTVLKVQFVKDGKVVKESRYFTDSKGVTYITPALPAGVYSVIISADDENITAKNITKTATIVKTTTKVTAKKVTAYKGYKITLKAVLSKTKTNEKINQGKVKFKINGKTYTVKVKKGVATKTIKLNKVGTYKYTAQFIGNGNIKKSKVASGKAIIKNRYATKITVNSIRGNSGDKVKYQIQVTTTSGKKVSSGQVKITWNGKSLVCNVTKGVVKLVGTLGGNFKEKNDKGEYFYKQFTTKFKAKYIPTSLKYKGSSANYRMISTYKCAVCGKTTTHSHTVNGTTSVAYVV